MGPIGFTEILIILAIILLLFGAKKIPELMRGIGKGMREFKDARKNDLDDQGDGMREEKPPVTATPADKL